MIIKHQQNRNEQNTTEAKRKEEQKLKESKVQKFCVTHFRLYWWDSIESELPSHSPHVAPNQLVYRRVY